MTRQIQLTFRSFVPRPARADVPALGPSTTRLRVHLGDLDYFGHVNNGVYLQMMDVGRTNYLADLGGMRAIRERRWAPVVAASTMTYRRSLKLGDRVELRTRVLGWDQRVTYLEQCFYRGGERCARGVVALRCLHRDGTRIPATEFVGLLAGLRGGGVEQPEIPDDVLAWARAVDVAAR